MLAPIYPQKPSNFGPKWDSSFFRPKTLNSGGAQE